MGAVVPCKIKRVGKHGVLQAKLSNTAKDTGSTPIRAWLKEKKAACERGLLGTFCGVQVSHLLRRRTRLRLGRRRGCGLGQWTGSRRPGSCWFCAACRGRSWHAGLRVERVDHLLSHVNRRSPPDHGALRPRLRRIDNYAEAIISS